ncbi:hypothetical protein JXC34_00520 [Candidatus Woesearchaeota archaeon]|nr:hypothetical protein [Candidatus Woesearchaeota archaeon]
MIQEIEEMQGFRFYLLQSKEFAALIDEFDRSVFDIIVKVGKYIKSRQGDDIEIEQKEKKDFVSEVDKISGKAITDALRRLKPGLHIVEEEQGVIEGRGMRAYVDPLDGTTNFIYGLSDYGVSIALAGELIERAYIYLPAYNELFFAKLDAGAFLISTINYAVRELRVKEADKIDDCLAFLSRSQIIDEALGKIFDKLSSSLRKHSVATARCYGTGVVGACRAAQSGKAVFLQPKSEDVQCAIILLMQEAGLKVCDFDGNPAAPESKNLVACSEQLYKEVRKKILGKGG